MIFDKIENANRYSLPQEKFSKLLEFFNTFKATSYQKGKFEIDTDAFFGIGLEYQTKSADECLWEAHRKYIDIHWILEGEEIIHVNEIGNMKVSKVYDAEGDYELFTGNKKEEVTLKANDFLILYPNEIHKTSIQVKATSSNVKKLVLKLLLDS